MGFGKQVHVRILQQGGDSMRRERYDVWMGTINYEHKTIGKEVYMGE